MRVSDVSKWAECEAYALADRSTPSSYTAAAVVGTLAHARLAGGLNGTPDSRRIAWDSTTKTWAQALAQASAIEEEALRELKQCGWTIIEQEELVEGEDYTGHLDLRCWHEKIGEAIIDLKTGWTVGTAWLQVGGYIAAIQREDVELAIRNESTYSTEKIPWGGVLHVPRVPVGKDAKAVLTIRSAAGLVDAWKVLYARSMKRVIDGGVAARTPGVHCGRCSLKACAVRI